jgi:signal transduction histidine kinase/FixJ family two-component response regulator
MNWTPLQKKIFVLVVSLFTLVYVLTLFSVYSAAYNQAEREFNTRLNIGRNVFLNEMTVAKVHFDSNVETIAKDWALRSAVGQGVDPKSITSILSNHGNRISAQAALVVDNNFNEIARYAGDSGLNFLPNVIQSSDKDKPLPWINQVGDDLFLMSAAPIEAPKKIGWLIMGKKLNVSFLSRVKELISLDINLIVMTSKSTHAPLTSLENGIGAQYWLGKNMTDLESYLGKIDFIYSDQDELIVLPFSLHRTEKQHFIVVLQDSISASLTSFNRFLLELLPYFIVGVFLAIVGSYYIARSITRPVGRLLEAAKRVASGHYTETIKVSEKSELSELASEFTHMQDAVMERESKIKQQAEQIKLANKNKFEVAIANKQKQLAEEATKAKSQFLANVSHEIRTPLNALIGYSEMLQDDTLSQKSGKEAIHAINNSANHLLSIVNDVLDVSKIEANKIDLEHLDIDLLLIIDEVKANMSGLADKKGILFQVELYYPLPAFFNTDPTRLKQILFNLCNNAIKFTNQGKVVLKVGLDSLGQKLIFEVLDTGIGMTAQHQQKLFQAFSQADQTTSRKFGGSGLGLFICKQLTELLGGTIRVTSELSKGSQFTVSIDLIRAADLTVLTGPSPAAIRYAEKEAIDIPKFEHHILCADDNEDNRILVQYLLSKTGARLTLVEDGKQAILACRKNNFDLILMDMQMPEIDGLEATQKLIEEGFTKPIVMLTANVDEASKALVKKVGASGHIGKPFDTQQFYTTLKQLLSPTIVSNDFSELVSRYVSRLDALVNTLELAKQNSDWQAIKEDLHKIKGTAANYGFSELSQIAVEVEASLNHLEPKEFGHEIDKLIIQLKQIINQHS